MIAALIAAACTLRAPTDIAPSQEPVSTQGAATESTPAPTEIPAATATRDLSLPLPGTRIATQSPAQTTPTLRVTSTAPASATLDPASISFPANFPDQRAISAGAGQTIVVTVNATINNPGAARVYLLVRDPAGEDLLRAVISETVESREYPVPVITAGEHRVLFAVDNLSGNYSYSVGVRN
jgi:hypothetical protein